MKILFTIFSPIYPSVTKEIEELLRSYYPGATVEGSTSQEIAIDIQKMIAQYTEADQ